MENANISWLVAIILLVAVALLGGWYLGSLNGEPQEPVPQEENGTTTEPSPQPQPQATYLNADADMIVVSSPQPGETVDTTFTVSGRARGNWYFEANFPIEVLSETGEQLVQSPVQAQGEWMTTEFVPFTVEITLPASYQGPATLVLRNDNASGLPEHDRSVSIPIVVQ